VIISDAFKRPETLDTKKKINTVIVIKWRTVYSEEIILQNESIKNFLIPNLNTVKKKVQK